VDSQVAAALTDEGHPLTRPKDFDLRSGRRNGFFPGRRTRLQIVVGASGKVSPSARRGFQPAYLSVRFYWADYLLGASELPGRCWRGSFLLTSPENPIMQGAWREEAS